MSIIMFELILKVLLALFTIGLIAFIVNLIYEFCWEMTGKKICHFFRNLKEETRSEVEKEKASRQIK